jgi:hypothetical protein
MSVPSFPGVDNVRFPYQGTTQRYEIAFLLLDDLFHKFEGSQSTDDHDGSVQFFLYLPTPLTVISFPVEVINL